MRKLQTGSCMLERYFLSAVGTSVSNPNRLLPIILNYLERTIVPVLHFYSDKTNIRLHYPSWSFYQWCINHSNWFSRPNRFNLHLGLLICGLAWKRFPIKTQRSVYTERQHECCDVDFFINQVSHSKNELKTQFIRYTVSTDAPNQSLTPSLLFMF